jgi:hypothetical protein
LQAFDPSAASCFAVSNESTLTIQKPLKVSGQLTGEQNKPVLLFGGTIVGVLIQTLTLGLIINSLQANHPEFSVTDGSLVGLALGVGIGMFASLSHRVFGGESLKVWIIETANDAINLTIASAIITYFN